MTPTVETITVSRTVFDLTSFDDVKLTKSVAKPAKPASVEEALAQLGNDSGALLAVIYDGLCERVTEQARQDMTGFVVVNDDGEPGDPYTGTPVNEEKGKRINAAILGIAKALGFEKSLPKEKKAALKDQAASFIRSNPAMLASIQG